MSVRESASPSLAACLAESTVWTCLHCTHNIAIRGAARYSLFARSYIVHSGRHPVHLLAAAGCRRRAQRSEWCRRTRRHAAALMSCVDDVVPGYARRMLLLHTFSNMEHPHMIYTTTHVLCHASTSTYYTFTQLEVSTRAGILCVYVHGTKLSMIYCAHPTLKERPLLSNMRSIYTRASISALTMS